MTYGGYGEPIDDETRLAIAKHSSCLSEFTKIVGSPDFPLQYVQAFLAVVIEEGLSVTEYARKNKQPTATMSRHLLDIGDRTRKMKPGLGLVTSRPNPLERRKLEYFLTDKGRALIGRMSARRRKPVVRVRAVSKEV
jgi:hypothetical protein